MKHDENKKLDDQNPINMKELDEAIHKFEGTDEDRENLLLIRRYLERLILIMERSRIREYMMLTDSKRRLFIMNFISGLGKGFGQAIGLTLLAGVVFYLLAGWVDIPIIGKYIAEIMDIVEKYREGR